MYVYWGAGGVLVWVLNLKGCTCLLCGYRWLLCGCMFTGKGAGLLVWVNVQICICMYVCGCTCLLCG